MSNIVFGFLGTANSNVVNNSEKNQMSQKNYIDSIFLEGLKYNNSNLPDPHHTLKKLPVRSKWIYLITMIWNGRESKTTMWIEEQ